MSNIKDIAALPPGAVLWIRAEYDNQDHSKYRIKITHSQKGTSIFSTKATIKYLTGNWELTGKELTNTLELLNKIAPVLNDHIDGVTDTRGLVKGLLDSDIF